VRKFEKAAMQIPSTFGIQNSSVSRKFIQATGEEVESLSGSGSGYMHDIIVIFMDGKSFTENGMIIALGISLKTTNCIKSLNSQLAQSTRKVTYWKNRNQRQRWVATALLEIEPSLRKVKNYRSLPLLKSNMEGLSKC